MITERHRRRHGSRGARESESCAGMIMRTWSVAGLRRRVTSDGEAPRLSLLHAACLAEEQRDEGRQADEQVIDRGVAWKLLLAMLGVPDVERVTDPGEGGSLRIEMIPQTRIRRGAVDERHDRCFLVAAELKRLEPLEGIPQLLQGVLPIGLVAGQEAGQSRP